jgi:hypothetical protein
MKSTIDDQINKPGSSTIVIPPAPEGYPLSTHYQVLVNGQACPVFDTRVFFELNNPNRVVSFAQFDFTGTVEVEVILSHRPAYARIRPTASG